jgi:hypothetical protein
VSPTLKTSDLRDAFIAAAFEKSGDHWLSAAVAAGHSSLAATHHYLAQVEWTRRCDIRLRGYQSAFWSHLEVNADLDVGVLRQQSNRAGGR